MEFKEKLQLLRTTMKLSQEELANKLAISRQSITKWENGQSFPDIQNLIQLSEIFKVSIDRLVKENDTCMVNLFGNENYPKQDIRTFLVRAKKSTYAAGENEILPSKPNSHDFRYEEGDYLYKDSYLGNQKFIGEECIWIKNNPVWAMNYYGQSLNENFNISFLKDVLSHVSVSMPFRGPEFYQKGDYIYQCQIQGDFEYFTGEEKIYCKQEKAYICTFHGGIIL
ncbi:MAG: helix-turn-helix transcriptional regulator [Lachnospiraceae bacterium]|nr:helix-turn-helix transcriptional regulator [Lachnospiraceae bacterium]